ncbi:MAG: chemotaxis regulator - transmits chemoreceptor signals to flagelllar motor component cheY [Segetibacter sp.]|nr:chemotaxis regulator - transmits chemoreceptor signals to flagelllar motor component cheY [Segetibacter sp.]
MIKKEFNILLVDDRPENLFSLQSILEQEYRHFIHAASGNEALRIALKNESIGLIMLDVQMPEMDGFEVARFLKSNSKTKDISIIFVTAINKEEQYVLKGFEEGAVDYLQKPLDVNVTRAKVNVFEKLYFSQQQLKHSFEEIDRVNKQLERFTHMVSHDLKSPLASIVTMLSIIRRHQAIEADDYLNENVDMIYIAANHLSDMISSILEYSKQSYAEQTVEEVDTKELISQIIFLLFPSKHIRFHIQDDLPVITTRKQKLHQVFQNLISNAIKYNDKAEATIEIGVIDKPDFYQFFVKDNGPGINKDDNEKIFQLFEIAGNSSSTDSSTGVGLNILKMLVEEQGGKIWAESNPGVGSTFNFEWRK